MIEDKISLLLKEIKKNKEALKEIKKDIKREEKLDTEDYIGLKKAFEDLKKQKKDMEEAWQQELNGMEDYQKLRELRLQKEEDIANQYHDLFNHIADLPQKPFMMDVELEEGPVKVQIMPEMRLYLNGREEKKKTL